MSKNIKHKQQKIELKQIQIATKKEEPKLKNYFIFIFRNPFRIHYLLDQVRSPFLPDGKKLPRSNHPPILFHQKP